jgi:hypothetical protein
MKGIELRLFSLVYISKIFNNRSEKRVSAFANRKNFHFKEKLVCIKVGEFTVICFSLFAFR